MENYTQYNPNNPMGQNNEVMSVKDWFLTLFITAIPLVGFIMLFVWAFGNGTNQNKANYAKAGLILAAIAVVFYILISFFKISISKYNNVFFKFTFFYYII